uniref:uncharacterized protein LOC120334672 n=1 Tax=Styela clava TaxID=7725 RepID=UPI00193A1FED|nr:uncharacterized protein LOC120334672 [Styela clava]
MDRNEDDGASGSESHSQSSDQSSADLEIRNHDCRVVGSATLLQTEQSITASIATSNVHMASRETTITKGQVATTIFEGPVTIKVENTDAASSQPSTSSIPTGKPAQPLSDTGTAIAPVYKGNSPGVIRQAIGKLFGGLIVRRFIDYFNGRTGKQTEVNVTESYKDHDLEEPEFEVNPKLNKVTGFYSGQIAPDITEYRREQEFAVTNTNENIGKVEVISPKNLVKQLCGEGCRCVGLVGQAGGGKTTTMKRTAQGVLVANGLDNESNAKMGLFARLFREQKSRFKFVHYLNFRDLYVSRGLTPEDALDPCELLFGKFAPISDIYDQTVRVGYTWLQEHQSEAIFFIDGLDQATWNLEGNYNNMKYTDKSSTATIIYNLLSGNLFPNIRLVISSREHGMASLPLKLRPQLFIALAGLERNDAKKLFTAIVGKTGEESWNKMTLQSPTLVPLSSVPLFLIFNAIVHKSNPKNLPDTMTDVMTQVLDIFMHSSHTQEKSIITVLHNLMRMSFEGTNEKRVIFNNDDLENAELTKQMIRDLIIEVPGRGTPVNQRLLEGDTLMFFSHQILQEFLSALYIANIMDLATFKAFVTNEIHKDHWSVVLRLLCGTLFNQKIKKIIKDQTAGARREKQNCLKRALTTMINQCTRSYQKLELFAALYESNDADLIRSHIHEINFEDESFTAAGMCAMSSVMRRCDRLEQVRLVNCELNAELLENFDFNLRGPKMQVSKFDISLNPMSVEAFDVFGSVLTNIVVEKLVMHGCSLTEEKIRVLGRPAHTQIHVLDVRNITNMTFELYLAIVKFASEHDVKELLMDPWDCFKASKEQLLELGKWKVRGKISVLDVRNNTNMTFDLYHAIVEFASEHGVKELLMDPWDCFKASEYQLLELNKWNICGKINVLDVQFISPMPCDLFLTISEFASRNGVKKILMNSLDLSKANKEQIKKLSDYKFCGEISTVDISQNPMDEESFVALSDFLSKYEVDEIIAINCRLTKAKLDALGSHSGLKLSRFNISENPMDEIGFNALGSVLSTKIKVLRLEMQNCQLTKEKVDALGRHSGLQICTLDIRFITGMTFDLFLAISKFASKNEVKELLMDPWKKFKATKDQIFELSKWKVCGKLDELDVSSNKNFGTAGFSKVGLVVSQCRVEALKAKSCNLTAKEMKSFKENTRNAKLDTLDISENNNLGTSGFGEVGSVVLQCQVKILFARACNLEAEGIKAFKGNTHNTKLDTLDISKNENLGTYGFVEVGIVVSQCQVKTFIVRYCNLTAEEIKVFKENTCNAKLDILDIRGNDSIGTSGFGEIGAVVSKCRVKEFGAWKCNLEADGMKAFKKNTYNAKINCLDLSLNNISKLGDEGLSTISEIVHQCNVEILRMESCDFNKEQLERFKALIAATTGVAFHH